MHEFLLGTHSIVRWFVLISATIAIVFNLKGLLTGGTFEKKNRIVNASFVGFLDLQLLLGLILYFGASPFISGLMKNAKVAMKDPALRFWLFEHFTLMFIAIFIAHAGQALSKRAEDDKVKFRRASIGFIIASIMIIAAIPWPFRANLGRALLPF